MRNDEELLEDLSPSALGLMAMLSERSMTGYEIKKMIDRPEFVFWRDSFGSIYPNLRKLTSMDLAAKSRSDLNGRKRLVYSLTGRGRELVRKWLSIPASKRPVKVELLLKLRFAYQTGPGSVRSLLEEYMDYHRSRLPDIYESLQYLDGLDDDSLRTLTRRMNADFWYRLTRMLVEWSEKSLELLDEQM